jgi:hypothetical protein
MPRTYKVVLGISRHKKYPVAAMTNAVEAVLAGIKQSEAARQFGVPPQSLSDAVRKKHPAKEGGQLALLDIEEMTLARDVVLLADWGFPQDILDIRLMVKKYLDEQGRQVRRFVENTPGIEWGLAFLKRRKDIISSRLCQNISRKRKSVSEADVDSYFDNLLISTAGIPPENIINFDETGFTDNPGEKKCLFRRGCKYPERVMSASKTSISVMFACSAAGKFLPPYVVYKAQHLHDRWITGGKPHVRYNRSASGWFDKVCFADWFQTIVVPYCRRLPGKKVIIGDNLSSHFCHEVIAACEQMGINFVCLPPNSTHFCQPLDVSVFAPTKKHWRNILTNWRMHEGRFLPALPKEWFPCLLAQLMDALSPTAAQNILSGFRKCGIVPVDKSAVAYKFHRTPEETLQNNVNVRTGISNVIIEKLNEIQGTMTQSQSTTKKRNKRLNVIPGKSISLADFQQPPEAAACSSSSATQNLPRVSQNEEESTDDDDDDDDIPVLPLFPVPADSGDSLYSNRYSQRQRHPVIRKDFI